MAAERTLHVAVACGGTGGHLYPGMATAEALRARGHRVTLWLTGRSTERAAHEAWGGAIVEIAAQGFPEGDRMGWLPRAGRMAKTAWRCRAAMRADRPDVLLAMGSYASAGPCFAAWSLRVPFVLHEANVIPGRAVRLFSHGAAAVAAGFEECRFYLRQARVEAIGIPLRGELAEEARMARLAREKAPAASPSGPFRLLVAGGSLGAHHLNEVAAAAAVRLAAREDWRGRLRVTHLTGSADEAAIRAVYEAGGVEADVRAFGHDMGRLYAAADFAICRAGGSTCAELSAFGVPALLVPYPHAANDHQTANARALAKRGAVDLAADRDLAAEWLEDYLATVGRDAARRARMREAACLHGIADGTGPLADLLERVGRGAGGAKK